MAVPPLKAHQIDYSRFIPFHPNTKSGRPVFIDPKLMIRFIELIDITDPDGEALANAIVGKLKALAGSATSDSNLNNAAQHRHYFLQQNVIVTYTILQAGGQHRFGGVFITDLERAVKTEKSHPPGFYSVEFSSRGSDDWAPYTTEAKKLTTELGVVGALEPDSQGQSSVSDSADAFGKYLYKNDFRRLNNKYSLFYTPSYAINSYGRWIGASQKRGHNEGSPKALADIFLETENALKLETKQRYCWYVFGNGAKQLIPALRQYHAKQTKPLGEHHDFMFIDPKVPIGELQSELKKVGITLTNNMLLMGGTASKIHALMDKSGAYVNLHRNSGSESKINKTLDSINRQLTQKTATTNFVQLAKNLNKAVHGGWA